MTRMLLIATAIALIGGSSIARADLIGVTSVTGGSDFPEYNGTNQTIGFEFTTSVEIFVTELGFYDETPANPLAQDHEVGLWDTSGNLLTSATVSTTDPLDGDFRYEAVTPVDLAAGTYIIGAAITSPFSDDYKIPSSETTSPDITVDASARNGSSQGFSFPSTVTAGNGRFGPNFEYVETVPEPVSLVLLSTGLLGLGVVRRRRG